MLYTKSFFLRLLSLTLFLLIWASYSSLYATTNISYYSVHHIGDTVTTYGDEAHFTARFYAFVDEMSCFTCMQTLSNIAKQLAKEDAIQIVLFMKTRNTATIERFKKDFEWNLPVVHDIATAYHQLYGVKNGPLCMLTDTKGKIYFMDIPGKASFNIDAFNQALSDIDAASNPSTNPVVKSQLYAVERYPLILKDNTPVREWRAYQGIYVAERDNFFLWDVFTRETMLIDRHGTVISKNTLDELPAANHGTTRAIPFFLGGRIEGDAIFCINLNWDFTSTLYRFHCNNSTLERMWDIPVDTTIYHASHRGLQLSDTTLLFAYDYMDKEYVLNHPTVCKKTQIVNKQGKLVTAFGQYESYHQTIERMANFALQAYCLGANGDIYMAENYSDTICVYNQAGRLLRKIPCAYDSAYWDYAWKERLLPLKKNSPTSELDKVIDEKFICIAEQNGLLYDDKTQELNVVYQNRHTATNGEFVYRFFLHRPERKGKTIRRDLPLPEDCKPIYINNGLIYCIEMIRGVSNLTVYKIPEWL